MAFKVGGNREREGWERVKERMELMERAKVCYIFDERGIVNAYAFYTSHTLPLLCTTKDNMVLIRNINH